MFSDNEVIQFYHALHLHLDVVQEQSDSYKIVENIQVCLLQLYHIEEYIY